ncbi:hypothetical protein RESH_06010 [Rhodopirellula europaea SH398]|uniref:Uncharacterized protein n=1 Tax=Rhodopirellula europaea SH398 TaxID=1263868 RepID=M5RVN4_9BACT|nr:hypothetical protein RESH_06010 [Rhodopirellula europaea SH398]
MIRGCACEFWNLFVSRREHAATWIGSSYHRDVLVTRTQGLRLSSE